MIKKLAILLCLLVLSFSVVEAKKSLERFKPYRLLTQTEAPFDTAITELRQTIESSEFKLAGEYSPYEGAHIFAITHPKLLAAASEGKHGGFGAVIRMAVTDVMGKVQVSYVNPKWMTNLFQIPEIPEVDLQLKSTFGDTSDFGSKKGKSVRALKGYQYMMFMPEFEDQDKLGSFDSHQAALDTINKNFLNKDIGLRKVFEVKIPNKDEVLFGVALLEGEGGDAKIMSVIDKSDIKHTAHLPYALLVSGDTAYALAGKFRIASAFPDLSMGTFMDISDAPDAIKASLAKLTK